MTILPNSLEARDVAYYFHPATNARRHEEDRAARDGERTRRLRPR